MSLSCLCSAGAGPQTHVLAKMLAAMALISNGYKSLLFTFSFFLSFHVFGGICCFVSLQLLPVFTRVLGPAQCEAELDLG